MVVGADGYHNKELKVCAQLQIPSYNRVLL